VVDAEEIDYAQAKSLHALYDLLTDEHAVDDLELRIWSQKQVKHIRFNIVFDW
jgi:hypothetical protein